MGRATVENTVNKVKQDLNTNIREQQTWQTKANVEEEEEEEDRTRKGMKSRAKKIREKRIKEVHIQNVRIHTPTSS